MFNVLLINGYDCRTLNDVQKEAVLTWVENGEHCLSEREETGIRPLDILGEAEPKVSKKDPEVLLVGMGTEYTKNSPGDSEIRVTYTEPVISGAEERMVTDGTPLLKTMKYGRGTIGVYGGKPVGSLRLCEKDPVLRVVFSQ